VVNPDSFLILNDGEPYSMEIDSRTPVATFCVFFQHGFVESVRGAMERNAIGLERNAIELERNQFGLDAPEARAAPFLPRLHVRDGAIIPRMQAIANAPAVNRLWLDQQFLALASDLLLLDAELRRRVRLLPASRPATREELFRRVRRGQEFIHASAADDIDLAAIARQACLSPYHFHRAFTCAFGQSPHGYRNSLRLAQAHRLLRLTEMTVTGICAAAGFESLASFSSLFRRQFGVPPSALRRTGRRSAATAPGL
jgi:AraC family transcriptional regulator